MAGVDVPTSGKVYLDGQDVYAQNNENIALQADRIICISDGKVVRDERVVRS